jgi:hypothetical protein
VTAVRRPLVRPGSGGLVELGRGELVARLFADYYEPVHLQDAGRAREG